jgi:hypothetical protein
MKIVYIAGRYSGATLMEVDRNVEEARNVALTLAKRRIPFLCTILQTGHFDSLLADCDPGYQYWIECSLEVLSRCDGMFLIPNWRESKGARKELQHALAHGMPVFEHIEALAHWIAEA